MLLSAACRLLVRKPVAAVLMPTPSRLLVGQMRSTNLLAEKAARLLPILLLLVERAVIPTTVVRRMQWVGRQMARSVVLPTAAPARRQLPTPVVQRLARQRLLLVRAQARQHPRLAQVQAPQPLQAAQPMVRQPQLLV